MHTACMQAEVATHNTYKFIQSYNHIYVKELARVYSIGKYSYNDYGYKYYISIK